MALKSKSLWIKVVALALVSPVCAIPSLFIVAIIVSVIPAPQSFDVWFEGEPFVRSIGFAVFTAILSVDSVLRAFYVTLPLLFAGAFGLLSLNIGIQSAGARFLITTLSVGLLYVVLVYAGVYVGWLAEPSWT